MTSLDLPQPPRGLKAMLWRAPIWFYRLGLGPLLGNRFLLLKHTGRISGQERQAVLEIVHNNAQADTHYVVSGFGESADWFQNILTTPQVQIQVGGRKISVRAERLAVEEAETILLGYAEKHPTAFRELTRLLKVPYDGSRESISAMATIMPVVAFYSGTDNPPNSNHSRKKQ